MKKKFLMFSLISFFLVLPTVTSKALSIPNTTSRRECPNIELANAYVENNEGRLSNVGCYDSYDAAKNAMYADGREDLVIIENGTIIDAKYGVVDYDVSFENNSLGYINVYDDSTGSSTSGHYIRCNQPDDAVILDYNYNTKRIKIKISGLVGWIDKSYYGSKLYDVIPVVWAPTAQSYNVTNDSISHLLPGNVVGTKSNYSMTIDIKPTMLNPGRYYSYDGHYFYTNIKTMINDYKNNTYANSVNPNNPYYNYYQYLSFRTKTIYNADNLNQFINAHTGSGSKLYNTGSAFINAQNDFGVNAAIMLSIGANESGWGNSHISQTKNNLFGLNAVDSNPFLQSDSFGSPADCIETYAYVWLSYGFLQPGDWRFKGANLGNKVEGLNLKYASDPFWGETAAHYYYELDKMFDFQERKQNQYSIAVLKENGTFYAKKTPNGADIDNETSSNTNRFYKYQLKDSAVVVLGEEQDNRGVTWYKIQSDPTLTPNLSYTNADSKTNPKYKYNWGSYVYVSSEHFRKITDSTTPVEIVTPETDTDLGSVKTNEIVSKSNYSYQNGIVTGINVATESNSLIDSFKNNGASEVVVKNASGQGKSGKLATGDIITITIGGKSSTFTVVIYGDTSGDGEITASDYVKIKNHIMGSAGLSGVYQRAADYNNDGTVSAGDYVKIKNYIMGG